MPPANTNLDVNVLVSVNKRFINRADVKTILQAKHDWNTPGLCFKGKTVGRSTVNEKVKYHVILDEAPGITLSLSCGCLKYIRRLESSTSSSASTQSIPDMATTENMLEDAIEGDNEEEEEIDLTSGGWTEGQVFVNSRLRQSGSDFCSKSTLSMNYASVSSPLDYFLFFLPLDHFHLIIGNTNVHARNTLDSWTNITFAEYLMWIALLTVMTVVKHDDRKAYWKQGSSRFTMTIDFSKYMPFKRFNDIMRMHVFEVPGKENQLIDPLYQIRSTISAFNCHMPMCISPGKYLVIDESMNQWLGIGMPNIKKVPRKPHPIGQEFKTLADCHTSCILRMDTVSDPVSKEFGDEPGMKKLTATVKRLVQPWFGSRRTVIADSWFGSPDMVIMLFNLGLFSIMQVCKRHYWPRGMPQTDIVEKVEEAYGSCYTMNKCVGNVSSLFTCAYRDQKIKAFISSCSTTIPTGEKVFEGPRGRRITIQRPEVAEEYETHKSK